VDDNVLESIDLVIGHSFLPTCSRFFPGLDQPYDFTLQVGGRSISGNTGSPFGYSLLYLILLYPEGLDFNIDFYGMTYEGNSYSLIDHIILMKGAFEKGILYFMRDTMKSLAPDGGTFLDAGANTGQHSLFMSPYVNHVHAFEPWESVLRRFNRMIEINGLKNIVVHPVGLGEREETLSFYEPPRSNTGIGSFVKGFSEEQEYGSERSPSNTRFEPTGDRTGTDPGQEYRLPERRRPAVGSAPRLRVSRDQDGVYSLVQGFL